MTLDTMQRKLAELEAKEQTAGVARAITTINAVIAKKIEHRNGTTCLPCARRSCRWGCLCVCHGRPQ